MVNDDNNPNRGQIRFWNSGPGSEWAKYQVGLDACFESINSLLVESLQLPERPAILDVGCGTGATLLAVARKAGPGARITGLDVSAPLLELARQRIREAGLAGVELLQSDAQEETLPASAFDLVVSRFGVMFFTNPVKAFANILQAIRPGGRLCFVAWGRLEDNPWFSIPAKAAVAQLGSGSPTDPKEPGPLAFSDTDYVADILQQAGFEGAAVGRRECRISTSLSVDEMAELACNLGPAVRLVREKNGSDGDQQAIRQQVTAEFASHVTENGVSIPASIVLVSAQRSPA